MQTQVKKAIPSHPLFILYKRQIRVLTVRDSNKRRLYKYTF